MPVTDAIYQFGEFQLDCERFELRRKGIPLRLERKPLELLILLASSGGRLVSRDEISRLLWHSEVFVDTEHGINTAIRKIRHALREDPDHPRFLQTVTGKGYRFVGAVQETVPRTDAVNLDSPDPSSSQPPAEVSVAPPAIEQPTDPPRDRARMLRLTAIAAATLLVIAAAGAAIEGAVHAHSPRGIIRSIAVLPLDNLSGDPSQNYLADGMTDELTTMLAKNSTLRVVSRTSVMQYKGAHRPLPEIARELNVDGILEGSLSRTGDDLHLTVQLINAPADSHIWAESYDRNTNDLVSLPRDAAISIAKVTHTAIPSAAPQKYVNPAAHDLYLQGNFHWFSADQAGAVPYYLKATQIQPDYAAAWSGLADGYGAGAVDQVLDPRQALPLAVAAAQKAVDLDPSLARAHLSLAADKYWLTDWNIPAALREVEVSIQLDPTLSQAWHMRGKLLVQQGHPQEGIEQERKAMEIDPFQRPWAMTYTYCMARNYDAAIADAKQRLSAHPDPTMWYFLSYAYGAKHMENESEHAWEQMLLLKGHTSEFEAFHKAFARGGRKAVVRLRLAELEAQSNKGYASPYQFADFYAQLGEKQKALAYLDESIRDHAPQLLDLQNDPSFDSLHTDPHYRAIVRQVGLPPAW